MKPSALERKYSVQETAKKWGFTRKQLWEMVRQGRIPYVRINGRVYFEESELQPWLEARRSRVVPTANPRPAAGRPSRAEECEALGLPVNHRYADA